MWTSCDPRNQFLSPYSYGHNPICGIDPDGKKYVWTSIEGRNAAIRLTNEYGSIKIAHDIVHSKQDYIVNSEYLKVKHNDKGFFDPKNKLNSEMVTSKGSIMEEILHSYLYLKQGISPSLSIAIAPTLLSPRPSALV